MKNFLNEQKNFLDETFERLSAISDSTASVKRDNKWSKKEIIGHLIDSASNNHQRFVRAQFKDDLVFPGYDQDNWVGIQDYQSMEWSTLTELWKNFNLLIIHLSSRIPDKVLYKSRPSHNLDLIAWKEVPAGKPTTLEYFIRDYFGHLRHHISRLFS
jgi:hypothetical protein